MSAKCGDLEPIRKALVDKIKRNRISTTEVADCLGKRGVLAGVMPVNRGHFRVGPVFWTYAYNESNWEFHEQIRNAPEEHIVLVEPFDCGERAIFGSLVCKFLILYRQVAGLVVAGKCRDAPHLIRENWPCWCTGLTPVGCFNHRNTKPLDPELIAERRGQYEGAVAVCDDCGVVIIPPELVGEEFLGKLDWIEEQEDIWFDCIDRRKWDTFETVCLKKYEQSEH